MEIGPQTDLSGVVVAGPTGPGWVVELKGHHFYNDPKADRRDIGTGHIRKTLLKELKDGFVMVPGGPGQPPERYTMKELGIGYAILPYTPRPQIVDIANPNYAGPPPGSGVGGEGAAMPGLGGLGGIGGAGAMPGAGGIPGAGGVAIDPDNPPYFRVTVYNFAVQFVWQEKPLNVRRKEKAEAEAKAAEAKAAAEQAAAAAAASGTPAEGAPAPGAPAPGGATAPPAPPVAAPAEQAGPAPAAAGPAAPATSNDGGAAAPVVPAENAGPAPAAPPAGAVNPAPVNPAPPAAPETP
jgi:hypothetical protein